VPLTRLARMASAIYGTSLIPEAFLSTEHVPRWFPAQETRTERAQGGSRRDAARPQELQNRV
jgi:hypothetical protein